MSTTEITFPPATFTPAFAQTDDGAWTLTVPDVSYATNPDRHAVIDDTHRQLRAWLKSWLNDPAVRGATGTDGRALANFLGQATPYQIDHWLNGGTSE